MEEASKVLVVRELGMLTVMAAVGDVYPQELFEHFSLNRGRRLR
jgi:hypothetical protein